MGFPISGETDTLGKHMHVSWMVVINSWSDLVKHGNHNEINIPKLMNDSWTIIMKYHANHLTQKWIR